MMTVMYYCMVLLITNWRLCAAALQCCSVFVLFIIMSLDVMALLFSCCSTFTLFVILSLNVMALLLSYYFIGMFNSFRVEHTTNCAVHYKVVHFLHIFGPMCCCIVLFKFLFIVVSDSNVTCYNLLTVDYLISNGVRSTYHLVTLHLNLNFCILNG